ncbi:ion transporter [Allokutzneria sp. A3M-2-11 16]|uniref:ion transporter n=1 Tax=Allokutzneria sp. A3M-2-11 16 TaxID=2962043 RepID=UPI0020B7D702|nr:ion transporter [Allokutzneria sp. A3M-2-11 16]MCP3800045.1 ion transporter [Allokutzneria sp. A3M-2-11 16]
MTRASLRRLVDSAGFQRCIIAVIMINAITLGLETSETLMSQYGVLLQTVDRLALTIFVVELALRFYACGRDFFADPWNCFDAVIIGLALLPTSGSFAVLRALRILRALRLVSMVKSMRRVVSALLTAIPGMASIAALLALVIYVGGVMATKLYGEVSPEYFGDLGRSLFTLFQVMTGEAWSDVARPIMDKEPWAWLFFVGFILITSFTVLNLFIAVGVSAMEHQVAAEREQQEETLISNDMLLAEVQALRAELRELREQTELRLPAARTAPGVTRSSSTTHPTPSDR